MSATAPRRSLRPPLWGGTCNRRVGRHVRRSDLLALPANLVAFSQKVVQGRAEGSGAYRLMKQVITARTGLAQAFRGGIAADEEGRDWGASALRRCSMASKPVLPFANW